MERVASLVIVIPAKAGISGHECMSLPHEIPACAGKTNKKMAEEKS